MITKQYIKQIFTKKFDETKPIVFFDRDGVITKDRDFLLTVKAISFIKSSIKALQLLSLHKYPIVIVSNQPSIARGWMTPSQLKKINTKIVSDLKLNNVVINAAYSCPHHPQATLPQYKLACNCRKPGTLMIRDVMRQFKIEKGLIIGDQTIDIKAGKDSGLKTFLVNTGYKGGDNKFKVLPDYNCKNSLDAAEIILKIY